jgi:hypothetical protein
MPGERSDGKARKGSRSQRRPRRSSNGRGRLGPAKIVARAKDQLGELTGRPVENVLGFAQVDGGWEVTVEIVELHRVPDSTDVLGSYTLQVDDRGDLTGYRRDRRYVRSQAEEG